MQRITLRRHRMYAAVQSKREQIRGVWRFRWTTMLVAWIVCLIGWLVVLALPDTYGAWAQVHIDPRTPLSQYNERHWPVAIDLSTAGGAFAASVAQASFLTGSAVSVAGTGTCT